MQKSWGEWVNENLARNCDPTGIAQVLLDNKFTLPAIRDLMGASCPPNLGAGYEPSVQAKSPPPVVPVDADQIRRKRESLSDMLRALSGCDPRTKVVERRSGVTSDEFLEKYYAANRPVILCGLMTQWTAAQKWTPEYLKATCGKEKVEIMASRESNPLYEIDDQPHRKEVRFADFVDMVVSKKETNDYYLTARNRFFTLPGMKPLLQDFTPFPQYLKNDESGDGIFFWFGPKGTVTPLHHDPMNIFMAQLQGRKRIKMIPSNDLELIYNHFAVYSQVDAENPDYERFPRFKEATVIELELAPGEVLFLPAGWWHHVRSLDMSMTLSFNNFLYPNNFEWAHPVPKKEGGADFGVRGNGY